MYKNQQDKECLCKNVNSVYLQCPCRKCGRKADENLQLLVNPLKPLCRHYRRKSIIVASLIFRSASFAQWQLTLMSGLIKNHCLSFWQTRLVFQKASHLTFLTRKNGYNYFKTYCFFFNEVFALEMLGQSAFLEWHSIVRQLGLMNSNFEMFSFLLEVLMV